MQLRIRQDNLESDISGLEEQRSGVIIEPSNAIAFWGKRVVFPMDKNSGIFEIVKG